MSLSVASILAESALRYPDARAVVLGDTAVTYAELWESARRYAAVLRERGIGPGDPVALLLPNVPDFPRAYYAVLALGGVVVPVHALLTAEDIAFLLTDSGAKLLVCAGPLLGTGAKGAELAGVEVLAVLDEGDTTVERLDRMASGAGPVDTFVAREPGDDAVILYTSGTTGRPKGAVLSQLSLVLNASISATDVIHATPADVILGCLPLFHTFGQTCAMNAGFWAGSTLVLMPRFDGAAALDLMVRHEVTIFEGVPTMYLGLLEAARSDERRPELKVACSGGAALPIAVLEAFREVFGADIAEGYGLSETSPVATFNQELYGRKPGTVGRPIWGVDVATARAEVEDRIELLPVGEIGEVVIRGHNVMSRYHNNAEATAAAVVDGWFRSGDLGTIDEDGFITIVDRKKDMVLRGGFNVYPREIEEVLIRHSAVAQVAVIPIPDDRYGEEICAVVVPDSSAADRDDEELRAELLAFGRDNLAGHKYPRRVNFVDALPLGPSGKVLKRELVAAYRSQ